MCRLPRRHVSKRTYLPALPFLGMLLLLFSSTGTEPPAAAAQAAPEPRIEGSISWTEPGREASVEITYEIPQGFYQDDTPEFFTFQPAAAESEGPAAESEAPGAELKWGETVYPPEKSQYRGTTVLRRTLRNPGDAPWPEEVTVDAGWQLCSPDGTCFMPGSQILTLEIPPQPAAETAASGLSLQLLTILGFALIGGFLLNLMPCVLPLLSVKAMQLLKQSRDDRRLILRNSLLYTAGILASFLVLALAVILLKASGEMAGWGFQFQNPGFVLFLTALIWVFSLSLFDVYVINPVAAGTSQKASQRGGGLGSFFTGIFAVLVATPCTAPFLGAALAYAFSQPAPVILAVLSMVGLGLASPFLLLGFFPGILRYFPKPGRWMGIFKEAMGFLLVGTALHLLKVLHSQLAPAAFWDTLWFLLVLTAAAWLYGKTAGPTARKTARNLGRLASALLVLGGAFFLINLQPPASAGAYADSSASSAGPAAGSSGSASGSANPGTASGSPLRPGWSEFSGSRLETLRDSRTPVLVVFSAEWCLSCQTNEKTVLKTQRMDSLLEETGTVLLYGDYTLKDSEIETHIRRWNRAGVPVYAYFAPGADSPRLLPEILSWGTVQSALSG